MANELTINLDIAFASGGISELFKPAEQLSRDVANGLYMHTTQKVDNSEEALLFPEDVSTGGYFCGINRDATSYVEIRQGTGTTSIIRLLPGDVCLFRWSSSTTAPYVISDGEDVVFEYMMISL